MAPTGPPALVVVTHQSRADLERNLPGQLAVADELGTTLVVVDNASGDGTLEMLRNEVGSNRPLSVVELPANRGYATAVNRGFDESGERDVLLLNPDVEVTSASQVEELSEALRERPRLGVLAPALINADGSPQPSAREYPSLLAMAGSIGGLERFAPARRAYDSYLDPVAAGAEGDVPWVIGAAMLIRRAAYEAVGGWDERFFLYMEDADFCRRLRRAGYAVGVHPEIKLVHGYARSSSAPGLTLRNSPARRRHVASLARFWSRDPRMLFGRSR